MPTVGRKWVSRRPEDGSNLDLPYLPERRESRRDPAAGNGTCPKCGTILEVPSAEDNPFAPPETVLGPPPGSDEGVRDLVPASVFGKHVASFRLLGADFLLLSLLILTVWLPGNLPIDLITSIIPNANRRPSG